MARTRAVQMHVHGLRQIGCAPGHSTCKLNQTLENVIKLKVDQSHTLDTAIAIHTQVADI